jgi:hypothetical protein
MPSNGLTLSANRVRGGRSADRRPWRSPTAPCCSTCQPGRRRPAIANGADNNGCSHAGRRRRPLARRQPRRSRQPQAFRQRDILRGSSQRFSPSSRSGRSASDPCDVIERHSKSSYLPRKTMLIIRQMIQTNCFFAVQMKATIASSSGFCLDVFARRQQRPLLEAKANIRRFRRRAAGRTCSFCGYGLIDSHHRRSDNLIASIFLA